MLLRPPRPTLDRSSAASEVYKRQFEWYLDGSDVGLTTSGEKIDAISWQPAVEQPLTISLSGAGSLPRQSGGNLTVADEDVINFVATQYAATSAARPDQRAFGPDANSLAVLPGSVVSGYSFNLTAQINDTQNGNQAVAGAETYLVAQGAAPVGDPGTGAAMTAVDGTFNSPIAGVRATVSTNGLAAGRYLALVRGRDSLNNWGPLGAQWMTICSWANVNCSANGVDVLDIQLTAQAAQDYWNEGTYTALYDVDFNGVGDGDLDVIDLSLIHISEPTRPY